VDDKGVSSSPKPSTTASARWTTKTGVISTVAGSGKKGYTGDGGKATAATFNEPYAVVVDGNGDLYVVDRLNAVVQVDAKTGSSARSRAPARRDIPATAARAPTRRWSSRTTAVSTARAGC
jgi:hypothetical protein